MEQRASIMDRLLWKCREAVLSRPVEIVQPGPEPVTVAGLFRTASGIGQSARSCADGLEAAGVLVHRVDLSAAFGQLELPAASKLSDRPLPGGTLIVHFNAPEIERALFLLGNWRGSKRRVIGKWVWEMPVTPMDWRPATRWLSEIWVPSQFAFDALRPLTDKPMKIVPYYISSPSLAAQAPAKDKFSLIALGDGKSSFARKNLTAAIRAFRAADIHRPAELILKTRHLLQSPVFCSELEAAVQADPRIRIVDGSLSRDEVMELISSVNVLLSLHRSEGFGLTIAEAMLREKAVIATAWSGNTDFMDEQCAVPVPYRLVPVDDSFGVYRTMAGAVWAEPDEAFAARAISTLAADPERLAALGQAARARVLPMTTGLVYKEALNNCQQQVTN